MRNLWISYILVWFGDDDLETAPVTIYRDKEVGEIIQLMVCNDIHEAHFFL